MDILTDTSVEIPELQEFYDDNWITGPPHVVKSGKEAIVYRCRAHPSTGVEYLAAKVYRSRNHRDFRNDSVYRKGRFIGDKRLRRAVEKKTRTGREVRFSSWIGHE